MSIIMLSSMITSMVFMLTNHPLSMGFSLLIQTMLISLMTGSMNFNYWYSFILFLIMVGGMLILFIYMTSVASNEKFKLLNMTPTMLIMMASIMILGAMTLMKLKFSIQSEKMNLLTYKETDPLNWKMSLIKFLNFPQNIKLIMLMLYLFLTLIAIVKITKTKMGPLRVKL
uniref:NADH-ubiquinone oxidoreductase chain 6 n=1 Tax=Agrilinae sp. 2 ACP-2013 TaxID=1434405 RepID=A0A3G4RYD5_9COLE|nr:NADH dehydrogenase subunit 6 [Agrilinae sp. 2 ACP-2013]